MKHFFYMHESRCNNFVYSGLTAIIFLSEEIRLYKLSSFFKKMKESHLMRNVDVLCFINYLAWFLLFIFQPERKLRKRATIYMEINLPAK